MLINLFDRAQAIVRDLLEFKDMVSIFGKYYIYANTVTSLVSCLNRRKPCYRYTKNRVKKGRKGSSVKLKSISSQACHPQTQKIESRSTT